MLESINTGHNLAMKQQPKTREEIGRRLRELRIQRGHTQKQLAEGCDNLDHVAISMFERGESLKRLYRHAPRLVEKLGEEVYLLAFEAINIIVAEDMRDRAFEHQVLSTICECVRERMGSSKKPEIPAGQPWDRSEWGLLPSAQELAERLGLTEKDEPLDLVAATRVVEAIQRLGLLRGWPPRPDRKRRG